MAAKRILIIGVGSIGERHLRCFQATDRVEVSLCDTNGELRERVASRYGVERSYEGLDAALEEAHDLAVVAVPAHLHLPIAARLAEAGIHLLIEKPLSASLAGIDSLVEMLAGRDLTVAVAYVLRHHPALRAMRTAIESGKFGRPVELVAVAGQHFPTYRPAYREIYYRDRSTGGGAVQDALTHVLNAAEWLIGPVHRLVADTSHQVLEGVDVEDTVHVIARHGDVPASFSLNQHQAPNESTITVICERGTCRFQLHRNSWSWTSSPEMPWEEQKFSSLQRDDLFVRQAQAFLDAVDDRGEPACPLPDAIQTLRVNQAVLASAEEGVWKRVMANT